jgi:type IX secretion system PorP/SprF family membrane protein
MLKFQKTLYFFILMAFSSGYAFSQDITYSQFYANPLFLNPAMAGAGYCPRITVNYRNQYPSLPSAFVSYSAAYDQYVDFIHGGVGVIVNYDKAGEAGINNISLNAMYAYRLNVSDAITTNFALQAGYGQRNTNWDDLVFGSRIDPNTGSILPPVGQPQNFGGNINYFDFGGGILIGINEKYFVGGAAHHVTQPDISFFSESDNLLNMKITAHAGAHFDFDQGYSRSGPPGLSISPNILYQQQGRFRNLNLGTYFSASYFTAGLWYRHAFENPDAVILSLGLQYNNLRFGYSYDFTISELSNAAGGAHEISLAWIFDCNKKSKRRRAIKCPTF